MNKFKAYKHITIKCTTDFSKNNSRSCDGKPGSWHEIMPSICKLKPPRDYRFDILARISPFIHQVKNFFTRRF